MTRRLGLVLLAFIFIAGACTCDPLPIDDHKYACITDSDCGPELSCVSGVCGGTHPPDAGMKDAGFDAGVDAGEDAGFDAGDDAGFDAGFDAGEDAGVDAGEDAGADAGIDAGIDAGVDAGIDAGIDAGVDAGIDAGVDAGIDAGIDAGVDAGIDAGVDAGVDAGFACHSDDQCASTAQRCAEGSGQCVNARNCSTNTDCNSATATDYCFTGGKGCRCVPGPNDAGATGVCRRRLGPCEPCTTDSQCGADAGFAPLGACFAPDGGAGKVCIQQKAVMCPCGTSENDAGFCIPIGGLCSPAPCGNDLQCPADTSCRPSPTCQCEPRCRWNFDAGQEDAPGCAAGQVCWVDSANMAATSPLYGYGRCRIPCITPSDCTVVSGLNPFGGANLKCASELLPDAGMSLARCRGSGACMDDAECALGSASASRGYCNRTTFTCVADCRIATNPVTTQPFNDCKAPNTCKLDAGMNVCSP